jgi:rubrerythrin
VSAATTRREALRHAALGGAALATTGLLLPAAAAAQSADDEELRDFLAEAVALEQIAVLGYALAIEAKGADATLRRTFELLRGQEQAHANALRTALDSLGFDPPDAPDDPGDSGVYDDADGIEDERATRLTNLLGRLAEPADVDEFIDLLVDLEREQIRYYLAGAPTQPSEDLATTGAEIAANQAQHLVLLEDARGAGATEALAGVTQAVRDLVR